MELLASWGEIDGALYVIVCGSFVAAIISVAFANGGAMNILALTSMGELPDHSYVNCAAVSVIES